MKKKLFLVSFVTIFFSNNTFSQYKNFHDSYGYTEKFYKDLNAYSFWADPKVPEMYLLTGITSMEPMLYLPSSILGKFRLKFDLKPPQVRLFRIVKGNMYPVWDWITGPIDTGRFSAISLQQWECYYNTELKEYVNVMGINSNRFYKNEVEVLDNSFHSIGGNSLRDPHDAQYLVHKKDTLFFTIEPFGDSKMICQRARTGETLGIFATDDVDINQSKINILTCLESPLLGTNYKEWYHTNSINPIIWSEDSLLVATSERHTSLVRFAWFVRQNDGTYNTSKAFLLGSNSDTFNQIKTRNGNFNIQAGHDFRFIQKMGDSIVCTYYDNHACGIGAKHILFTLYPRTKELVLLDSINPTGYQTVTSQALGSSRLILGKDKSYASIKDAPLIVNWAGERQGKDTFSIKFPILGIDTMFVTGASAPLNEPGRINIFNGKNHQQVFGIDFGYAPDNMTDIISGKIQASVVYRCNAYLPDQINFPKQPKINYKIIGSDTLELSVAGYETTKVSWSTGDSATTIRIPKNDNITVYLAKLKTDANMRGELYTEPFYTPDYNYYIAHPQTTKRKYSFFRVFWKIFNKNYNK